MKARILGVLAVLVAGCGAGAPKREDPRPATRKSTAFQAISVQALEGDWLVAGRNTVFLHPDPVKKVRIGKEELAGKLVIGLRKTDSGFQRMLFRAQKETVRNRFLLQQGNEPLFVVVPDDFADVKSPDEVEYRANGKPFARGETDLVAYTRHDSVVATTAEKLGTDAVRIEAFTDNKRIGSTEVTVASARIALVSQAGSSTTTTSGHPVNVYLKIDGTLPDDLRLAVRAGVVGSGTYVPRGMIFAVRELSRPIGQVLPSGEAGHIKCNVSVIPVADPSRKDSSAPPQILTPKGPAVLEVPKLGEMQEPGVTVNGAELPSPSIESGGGRHGRATFHKLWPWLAGGGAAIGGGAAVYTFLFKDKKNPDNTVTIEADIVRQDGLDVVEETEKKWTVDGDVVPGNESASEMGQFPRKPGSEGARSASKKVAFHAYAHLGTSDGRATGTQAPAGWESFEEDRTDREGGVVLVPRPEHRTLGLGSAEIHVAYSPESWRKPWTLNSLGVGRKHRGVREGSWIEVPLETKVTHYFWENTLQKAVVEVHVHVTGGPWATPLAFSFKLELHPAPGHVRVKILELESRRFPQWAFYVEDEILARYTADSQKPNDLRTEDPPAKMDSFEVFHNDWEVRW